MDESGLPVYVMRYEEMLADPQTAFGGLVRFAGLDYNAQHLDESIAASSFESLQQQEEAKGFARTPSERIGTFAAGGPAVGVMY